MPLLLEQLQRRLLELEPFLYAELGPPAEVHVLRGAPGTGRHVDFDIESAPLLSTGGDWREAVNTTIWLRFQLHRPETWPSQDTVLVAQRFGTLPVEPGTLARIGLELQRMQGMLYLDGRAYHGLDQYHRLIHLPGGPEYDLAASVWTGLAELDWQPNPVFRLAMLDPGAMELRHDLRILADALATLPADDTARVQLEDVADALLRRIDWSQPGSTAFRATLAQAHAEVLRRLESFSAAPYEPTLVAVGHAHIDCAWLWPIAQTREKAGRTWSTALRLMEHYPEYHFLASTPLQYEMVKHDFPETFEGIRQRVAEGRWEPVGGMWVEADCNLPDGESLARQMLLGTRYFEREFGVQTTVVWLPDTFGFPWALPTLLGAAGLRRFVTHKLSWSQTNRIPHDTFRWRGPDGSEVLAHFLCTPSLWPGEKTTYNGTLLPSIARGGWQRFSDRHLQSELLVAFGYGDGGGGPSIDMLEGGRRLKQLPGFPRVKLGRADEFFDKLENELRDRTDVPVWDGELYLEYHRGTYTGQARQKLRNARSQRLYHAAELYAATARALLGTTYPSDVLDEGWRLILTNQFHDILPGSAISQVYVDAEADYEHLAGLGQRVLDEATSNLAGAMDLQVESLVIFNPAPYASSDYVEVPPDCEIASAPSQSTADGRRLVFCEGVPPNGYKAFALGPSSNGSGLMRATPRELESPFWDIELDEMGRIARLSDKRHAREVVPAGEPANHLRIFEDRPLNFDAWDIDAYYSVKWRELEVDGGPRVLESGHERVVIECCWRIGDRTRIRQRMCLYARVPRIDFVTDVDWYERQSLLKVSFPTSLRSRRATYEIQFGSIERATHRNTSWEEAAFEVPAQRWADLSDAHYGVAVLADCKHGYSVHDGTLWLSLLKGAIDPDPQADIGRHHFTYSLLPHSAGLDAVRRAAYSLTRPFIWRREAAHRGPLAPEFSLAQTDCSDVLVETAKWAEDTDALVLRLYEAEGGATTARLRLGTSAHQAQQIEEVDLLERNPREMKADAIDLRAREIKTLLIR